MKLLTQDLLNKLPPLYSTEKQGDAAVVQCKFFAPWSFWTWYCSEYSPEEKLFFGYVVGEESELGYFSLDELESVVGPFGLKIERDLYFTPCTLGDIRKKLAG